MQKQHKIEDMPQVHPAVYNRTSGSTTGRIKQQATGCGKKGCKKRLTLAMNDGTPKSLKQFKAAAAQKRWAFDEATDQFYCPHHHPDHPPDHTPENPVQKTMSTEPRQMDKMQRRTIFREIDDSYDDKALCYCSGITDKTIADKLRVPWAWVAEVRDENFGPAGPDPKLKELVAKIEMAEQKAQEAFDSAMGAAERADGAVAEAKALKGQLLALLPR